MIKKVTLKDFQCHKLLVMEFGKFTTLTGGSNGGKTSVLRAILGLVRNDSVADYVRLGQKSLSVTLELDSGHTVEWQKGDGTNKYILTDPDGTVHPFDKVGATVPEEVSEVLRLGPVAVKGSDKEYVNFHSQLESPFLISATPGTVAKLFGELTSASQLYTAVGEGNRQVRSTNGLKSTRKEDLDAAKLGLLEYVDLAVQQENLAEGTRLYDEAVVLDASVTACKGILDRIDDLDRLHEEIDFLVAQMEPILTVDLDEVEDVTNDVAAFARLVMQIADRERTAEEVSAKVAQLESIPDVDIEAIESLNTRIAVVSRYLSNHTQLVEKESSLANMISENQKIVNSYENQITEKFNELEECPECGQGLDEEAKGSLIDGRVAHAAC